MWGDGDTFAKGWLCPLHFIDGAAGKVASLDGTSIEQKTRLTHDRALIQEIVVAGSYDHSVLRVGKCSALERRTLGGLSRPCVIRLTKPRGRSGEIIAQFAVKEAALVSDLVSRALHVTIEWCKYRWAGISYMCIWVKLISP